jgi:hypothetical protein
MRQHLAWWRLSHELLWTQGATMSPSLDSSLVWGSCRSIWTQDLSIVTKRLKKSHRISPKSVRNGLLSKHSITVVNSIQTFGNPFGWELSYVWNLVHNVAYSWSGYRQCLCYLFSGYSSIVRIVEWMAPTFPGIATWVGLRVGRALTTWCNRHIVISFWPSSLLRKYILSPRGTLLQWNLLCITSFTFEISNKH